jgi:hypothetical protein
MPSSNVEPPKEAAAILCMAYQDFLTIWKEDDPEISL